MLSALRQISKQKMTISSTKLKIRKTVGLKKKPHTRTHTLDGGFKKMRFRSADSLVSCGQKADSSEKKGCGFKNTRMRVDGRKFP